MFKTDWLYKLYLPVAAGRDAHSITKASLCHFGGFTTYLDCQGYWQEDKLGKIEKEAVQVYEFIIDRDNDWAEKSLEHLKECIFKASEEKAILITKLPTQMMMSFRKDNDV